MCYVTGGGPEAKCMRRPPLSRFVPESETGRRPFTDGSFGNKFRDWCNQVELYHCSAHGRVAATEDVLNAICPAAYARNRHRRPL